jgi:neurotransmitter:Na+ symporter, NSS family
MLLTLFVLFTGLVVAGGVTRGIGTAVEILMPLLFIFLLILLGYSIATGDFLAAVDFMFYFDFSQLTTQAVLVAMGQAFFTLSLGMGAIMAYGSYMPGGVSIGKTAVTVGLLDTVVALVAGLAIFPLVFANDLPAASGPGLMFVSLPIAFANMPAGVIFGSLFFVLIGIAALSSSISLIEPFVAWMEKNGVKRSIGTLLIAGVGWAGGVLCVRYEAVFDFLDHITTNYMLPLGGLLITLFVGWIMRREAVRQAVAMDTDIAFRLWHTVLRYVTPAGVILVFLHSLGWLPV